MSHGKRRGGVRHNLVHETSEPSRRNRLIARNRGVAHGKGESWFATKRPVLRFVVFLVLLLAVFNASFYLWFFKSDLLQSYLQLYATLAAGILQIFGDNAVGTGRSITSSRFSLSIEAGCDAIQASAFFVFAVLAYPSAVRLLARVPYLLFGTLLLAVMNLVRIVSLYYTGVYLPNAFEVMHIDVWQALFIFLPLILWIQWARRAMQTENVRRNVGT